MIQYRQTMNSSALMRPFLIRTYIRGGGQDYLGVSERFSRFSAFSSS